MARKKTTVEQAPEEEPVAEAPAEEPVKDGEPPVKAVEEPPRRTERSAVDTRLEVLKTVRDILSEPLGPNDLPTLLSVRSGDGMRTYHLAMVSGPALERAWDTYRSRYPGATPEMFIGLVYDHQPETRAFRAVSRLDI